MKLINSNSKSQGAVEFMIILVFVLVIIAGIMYVVAIFSLEIKQNENVAEIDNFAKSIVSEFEMLQKVEEGYSRNITIPYHLAKKYNIEINSSYLILLNTEYGDNNSENKRYYELPGNSTYTLTNDSEGNYYLFISKNITKVYEGISLN